MSRVAFSPIPLEDFQLPEATRETFDSLNVQLVTFAQLLDRELQKARTVYIPGQGRVSQDRAAEQSLPWKNQLRFLDGTLAEARYWARKQNWSICNGIGAPDLRESFVRGAAANAGAGTSGGTAVHIHNVPGCEHLHAYTIASHNHGLEMLDTRACSLTVLTTCGPGPTASPSGHIHGLQNNTQSKTLTGNTDNTTPGTVETVAMEAGGGLPPYYDVIILRKN